MRILTATMLAMGLVSCAQSSFEGGNRAGSNGQPTPTPTPAPVTPISGQPTPTQPSSPNPGTINPELPNPKGFDVEFGGFNKAWHLGDNRFSDTNCKIRVALNTLDGNGKQYNFNFLVERNGTTVDIVIKHCGVDSHFANKHPLTVLAANYGTLASTTLVASTNWLFMKSQAILPRLTFNQGWHRVHVETTLNPSINDWDDFIVGNVQFKNASGPIKLGDVTAN